MPRIMLSLKSSECGWFGVMRWLQSVFIMALMMPGPCVLASTPSRVEISVVKGVDWLLAQPVFRRKDVIVFSHWIFNDLTKVDEKRAQVLHQRAQQAFVGKRRDDPMLRNILGSEKYLPVDVAQDWVASQKQSLGERLTAGKLGASAGGTQDFLLISLYADDPHIKGQFDPIFQSLFTAELDRYGTTHQLMAVHFLRQTQAFPQKTLDAVAAKHVARMIAEMDAYVAKGEFIDLIAEQLAFLALLGYYHELTPARMEFLTTHQAPDGGWRQPKTESSAHTQIDFDQHATILAVYALLAHAMHYREAP
jgi:hypothetical protein